MSNGVLVGPPAIASYPNVWTAKLHRKAKPGDRPTFNIAHLYTDEAMGTEAWQAIVKAVNECAVARFGAAALKVMIEEGKFESPFKRDVKSKGYPDHVKRYITSSANEDYPPTVWKMTPAGRVRITDKAEIYPGCIVRVSMVPRAYGGLDTGWNPGVKLDLRNVLKVGDGDRLAGGGADGSEFGDEAKGPAGGPDASEFGNMLD